MSSTVCARCRFTVPTRHLGQILSRPQRRLNHTRPKTPDDVVIFSGIQPTGVPHLGNYLGAMRQWKQLQDEAPIGTKLFYSIVDLHAITMPQDAHILRQRSKEMLAILLAIGLDPKKSTLFYQSSVPAHAELMWILSCTASMGYLGRMTQWKSKLSFGREAVAMSDEAASKLKLGLFSYPVLQAADILIHRATHVPVGDDQKQHLEFARECVTNFNHSHPGANLVAPETITTPSSRVMDLTNPAVKMSKSAPNHRSRILVTAGPEEIRSRIMKAVTDFESTSITYEPKYRPGVANLLELYSQCDPERRPPDQLAGMFMAAGATLKDFKEVVAKAVVKEVEGIKENYEEVLNRKGGKWLTEIEAEGAAKARQSAEETMRMVRDAVGLSRL